MTISGQRRPLNVLCGGKNLGSFRRSYFQVVNRRATMYLKKIYSDIRNARQHTWSTTILVIFGSFFFFFPTKTLEFPNFPTFPSASIDLYDCMPMAGVSGVLLQFSGCSRGN